MRFEMLNVRIPHEQKRDLERHAGGTRGHAVGRPLGIGIAEGVVVVPKRGDQGGGQATEPSLVDTPWIGRYPMDRLVAVTSAVRLQDFLMAKERSN